MASQDPPLDEIQWRSPQQIMAIGAIHSNTILFYFHASPFFDQTSNNAILYSQALYNQATMSHVIATREAFEARLKTMSGLEFMVAQEPAEMAPGTGTGVWVIRKQTRRKRPGEEDEVVIHSTYFVVGDNIYMAPTLADVLGSRLLTSLNSLNKFMSTAIALPDFSPALGHYYQPPASSTRHKSNESILGQASKESTPLPDALQAPKKPTQTSTNSTEYLDNKLFEETLNISFKYEDQYMDENPITGQPGEFHLSTTGRKEKLVVQAPSKGPVSAANNPTNANKPTFTPTPPLKTDIPPARKGSKSEKSPRTPGLPKPKRRKTQNILVRDTADSIQWVIEVHELDSAENLEAV
ncbi:hypothetical protein B7494_g2421 [Chlorociboria aeruginascens]|nr:hypothetical protein B7494_g2421 [Chlorociboria aeruginascens]